MLPVSTVYVCWKHGDMVDAYLSGYQVLLITQLSPYSYRLISISGNGVLWDSIVRPHSMLTVDEGIEGVAA